jgi:NADH dehydrogenase
MATISRFRALAVVGRIPVAGFAAWLLWLAVHLVTLTGFKNQLAALFNWAIAFLGRGRPQRVITVQQIYARRALEQQPEVIPAPHSLARS